MKPITIALFIAIVTLPMMYISACAPAPYNPTYGVSVHGGSYWGPRYHRRHYHHRPAYRHHHGSHHGHHHGHHGKR